MSKMRVVQVTRPNGSFEIVEREIPEPGAGQVRIKVEACGICHSDSMTKEACGPAFSTLGFLDMRSPESLTSSPKALLDGQKANGSELAGTAGTAGTANPAGVVTLLPAKPRSKSPASPTMAATPNT
jgi:hypothetical protein